MCELVLPPLVRKIAESGKITEKDVLDLRKQQFGDGMIDRKEAELLFALDNSARMKCEDWSKFFNEAVTHYVIESDNTSSAISNEQADWLIRCISKKGLVDSYERMELLVRILEKAEHAPETLQSFALEQVRRGVLENQGPIDRGRYSSKQVICKADVETIRRLLFAFSSSGGMAVSKAEAEFLFELNDQTIEHRNDPSWSDLFVKAIANHLLATNDGRALDRKATLSEDRFLEGETMTDFLVNSLKSVFSAMRPMGDRLEDAYAGNNKQFSDETATAEQVTITEKQWLIDKIKSDSLIHENEKALLKFLKKEAPHLPNELQQLFAEAS